MTYTCTRLANATLCLIGYFDFNSGVHVLQSICNTKAAFRKHGTQLFQQDSTEIMQLLNMCVKETGDLLFL
jgi:hypothetical protein